MTIRELISDAHRNRPLYPTTMSQCDCGRSSRRGGCLCDQCVTERLRATGVVPDDAVEAWLKTLDDVYHFEAAMVQRFKDDASL